MNRETVAGVATVRLLCATFEVSRQAYYAAKKGPGAVPAKVVRLPVRPDVAPVAKVLAAIEVIIKENPAWGVRKVWAALRREHELKGLGRRALGGVGNQPVHGRLAAMIGLYRCYPLRSPVPRGIDVAP